MVRKCYFLHVGSRALLRKGQEMIKNNDAVVQKHLDNSQAKVNRASQYLLSNGQGRVLQSIERRMALSLIDAAILNLENAKDRLTRNDWAVTA